MTAASCSWLSMKWGGAKLPASTGPSKRSPEAPRLPDHHEKARPPPAQSAHNLPDKQRIEAVTEHWGGAIAKLIAAAKGFVPMRADLGPRRTTAMVDRLWRGRSLM
ncbi:hypothetical protein [Cereibacter sphaeroides]|uniref:hypothetical protein n=1 Tax=Cereibacter sphaeroides TaxID=1063 RepID=UPI0011AE1AE9|nr:hypothetical protein [Cereibacter sphaeroides]